MTNPKIPENGPGWGDDLPLPLTPPASQRPEETSVSALVETTDSPVEVGGPHGPEPTRYDDWEVKGRCSDF